MEDHEHLTVSEYHRKLATLLDGDRAAHGWACVMAFYSAYHIARWALRRDARFDDPAALTALNPELIPDDRHTDRHRAKGRQGGSNGFGINYLVGLFYPNASRAYTALYQASLEVRYKQVRMAELPPAGRLTELLDDVCANIVPEVLDPNTSKIAPTSP